MTSKKQSTGLKRDTTDKFYTKPEIVSTVCEYIIKEINIDKENDLIIEPSAGNGSFIQNIKKLSDNYKFYDLKPENSDIIEQDFLTLNNNNLITKYKKIHIIGNPPFGRQSSLAFKFIKHCAKFANTISFILPKSFKKNSMKDKVPLNFHLKYEIDLPENAFFLNNEEYNVPCVFQIWVKSDIKRVKNIKLKPNNFTFVKRDDNPDISFRRVGVYAGKISNENIEKKSIQSHYFIKFNNLNNINLEKLMKKLEKIVFTESTDTVGPKSISKQDIIREYNKVL